MSVSASAFDTGGELTGKVWGQAAMDFLAFQFELVCYKKIQCLLCFKLKVVIYS